MKHDILSRFIELGDDLENNITDKTLRDVVLNFVIAGRDTTATTLSWAIYMIMTHQEVAEKLFLELKKLEEDRAMEQKVSLPPCNVGEDVESFNQRVAQFAQLLNYDALGKLYYLHAVITETLRLYPAVPQVCAPLLFTMLKICIFRRVNLSNATRGLESRIRKESLRMTCCQTEPR